MTPLVEYCDEAELEAEANRINAAFTRRLTEIAALSSLQTQTFDSSNALDALRQPVVLLDAKGFVAGANGAAAAVFNSDIRIRDKRIFIRDLEARTKLRVFVEQLKQPDFTLAPALDPIIVPRQDKLPVLLRLWTVEDGTRWLSSNTARAIMILNALGPRPGPPAGLLAKTFGLTPAEAKLACIIARGAGPEIAAMELKICRETARNQLKAIFAKTDTHRQSELVALLLQVQ